MKKYRLEKFDYHDAAEKQDRWHIVTESDNLQALKSLCPSDPPHRIIDNRDGSQVWPE